MHYYLNAMHVLVHGGQILKVYINECRCGFPLHTFTIQFFIHIAIAMAPICMFPFSLQYLLFISIAFSFFFSFRIFHLFSTTSLETVNLHVISSFNIHSYSVDTIFLLKLHICYIFECSHPKLVANSTISMWHIKQIWKKRFRVAEKHPIPNNIHSTSLVERNNENDLNPI